MKVKLLGAIDYKTLAEELKNKNVGNTEEIIEKIKELEKFERVSKVSSAGRLSRFSGDVFDVCNLSNNKTLKQNTNFASRVIEMGHDSITDHDYLVFALKDVSVLIEQIIIEERFASFTIKSRREADFSNAGFYVPNFRDKNGNYINDNNLVSGYKAHMEELFDKYNKYVKQGIPKEDARFVLPYCYYSNIIMGVDAHTLKDMIIKYTKGPLSNISEVKEFGNKLYEIAKENVPYIIPSIDSITDKPCDNARLLLDEKLEDNIPKYEILDKPALISRTSNVDDTILISAIMTYYQVDHLKAKEILDKLKKITPNIKEELMRKIVLESDGRALKQVNFQFQIPLSYAVLTHLTRHRTHPIMVPSFLEERDLLKYKIPPKIKAAGLEEDFKQLFYANKDMYMSYLNDCGVRKEDLVYFTLSGNMVNVVTNLDGKTLAHILRLRKCSKAQWETRQMAINLHKELKGEDVKLFSSNLGPTCETQGICNEGKESCGRIKTLKRKN